MSTSPKNARIEDPNLQKAIPSLAVLYDRFANAFDPFTRECEMAEEVFGEEVRQWYDFQPPPKPSYHEFQKAIIVRCRAHLKALRKPPTV